MCQNRVTVDDSILKLSISLGFPTFDVTKSCNCRPSYPLVEHHARILDASEARSSIGVLETTLPRHLGLGRFSAGFRVLLFLDNTLGVEAAACRKR